VAEAVATLGLAHAVVTCVTRDDLPDGGAGRLRGTISEIRARSPRTRVEVLISDCRGDAAAHATIFEPARRPQPQPRDRRPPPARGAPSAGYARSLTVLARAKDAGLVTKSGLIVGWGRPCRRCTPRWTTFGPWASTS